MLLTYLIIGIYSVWILLTVLNQWQRSRKLISLFVSYDIFGLVPIWTFFAPNPGNTDTHLLFRDMTEDGNFSPWKEVNSFERRTILTFWNPRRRISKAIVDLLQELTMPDEGETNEERRKLNKKRVLRFPYLLILNFVSTLPRDQFTKKRQFAIAKTSGFEFRGEPYILLISAIHDIE